jgi:uncharacterized protein (TIGR03435 family)
MRFTIPRWDRRSGRRSSSRLLPGAGLCIFTLCAAFGQAPAAPAFDVASVKKSDLSGMMGEGKGEARGKASLGTTPGTLNIRNMSLHSCVEWAYHLKDYQVTGPGWIDNERFDIVGKAADPVRDDELRKMLQTLLADRFKLVFHRETRELPVYALTVGKEGSKMKQSEGEGESNLKPKGARPVITADHTSMTQLAELLSQPLRRPVIDMTGLKGGFDFTIDLEKYVDVSQIKRGAGEGHGEGDMQTTIETAVVMALREQLGLKLESKKSPIDMIIVDKAEKVPTEN